MKFPVAALPREQANLCQRVEPARLAPGARGTFGCATALLLSACLIGSLGCSRSQQGAQDAGSSGATTAQQPARASASKLATAREDLDQIPPPSKSRYLAIHTIEGWSNPFIIVGKKTVTLRMYYPDAVANGTLPGGMLPNTMLRPSGARKRELDLRLADLPEALAALPPESWSYGRVVALEEDPSTPRGERVQMRRNYEAAIQMLNDLGVVVNEWSGAGAGLLR